MADTTPSSPIPPIPSVPAPQKPHTKGKMPSTVAFAIGVVLFFLPFVDIQCNNMSLKKVSGTEFATGFKVNGLGSDNSLFDGLEKSAGSNNISVSKNDKRDPNVYALAALVLGALGLLLSFSNLKAGGIGGVLTGALSAASLIGLWIDVRRQLKTDLSMKDMDASVNIAVEFTPWFYIAVIAFAAAAYFSYQRMKT